MTTCKQRISCRQLTSEHCASFKWLLNTRLYWQQVPVADARPDHNYVYHPPVRRGTAFDRVCLSLRVCLSRSCSNLCNRLPGKTRLRNDLLYIEWDVKLCTLTHPAITFECFDLQNSFSICGYIFRISWPKSNTKVIGSRSFLAGARFMNSSILWGASLTIHAPVCRSSA